MAQDDKSYSNLCAREKGRSSVHPCHLFVGLYFTFSLPIHHITKHHLHSTTCSKTTLYTEHFFQTLFTRQAALKNRSRTSIARVGETRATLLPQIIPFFLSIVPERTLFWSQFGDRRRRGLASRRLCGRRRKPRLEQTTTERRKFFSRLF